MLPIKTQEGGCWRANPTYRWLGANPVVRRKCSAASPCFFPLSFVSPQVLVLVLT